MKNDPTLIVKRLGKYWWILGDEDAGPMGPYDTKAEAEDDRKGVKRFYKWANLPSKKERSQCANQLHSS